MSYTFPTNNDIFEIIRQPTGLAILASLGLHGLVGVGLETVPILPKPKDLAPVQVVELTPEQLGILAQLPAPESNLSQLPPPPPPFLPETLPALPPLPSLGALTPLTLPQDSSLYNPETEQSTGTLNNNWPLKLKRPEQNEEKSNPPPQPPSEDLPPVQIGGRPIILGEENKKDWDNPQDNPPQGDQNNKPQTTDNPPTNQPQGAQSQGDQNNKPRGSTLPGGVQPGQGPQRQSVPPWLKPEVAINQPPQQETPQNPNPANSSSSEEPGGSQQGSVGEENPLVIARELRPNPSFTTKQDWAIIRLNSWLRHTKTVSGNPALFPKPEIIKYGDYPPAACEQQLKSVAIVAVLVGPDGQIAYGPTLIQLSEYQIFNRIAEDSAKEYQFEATGEYQAYSYRVKFEPTSETCPEVTTTQSSPPSTESSVPPTESSVPPTQPSAPPTESSVPPTQPSTPPTELSAPPNQPSTPPVEANGLPNGEIPPRPIDATRPPNEEIILGP